MRTVGTHSSHLLTGPYWTPYSCVISLIALMMPRFVHLRVSTSGLSERSAGNRGVTFVVDESFALPIQLMWLFPGSLGRSVK